MNRGGEAEALTPMEGGCGDDRGELKPETSFSEFAKLLVRKMGRDIDRRASLMEFAGLSPAKSTTNTMGHRPHRDRGGGC